MKFYSLSIALLMLLASCSSHDKNNETVSSTEPGYPTAGMQINDEKAAHVDVPSDVNLPSNVASLSIANGALASYAATDANNAETKKTAEPTPVTLTASTAIEKKIIKNATMKFQVKELKKSSANIDALAKKYNAYVSSSNQGNNYGSIYNNISIRVPASKFEDLLNEVEKESIYLETKNISSQDVTEEYVDTETRIKTKKEIEQRYKEILRSAKSIDEILAVEAKIAGIREEIEAKEGRLKFLADNVMYSTINVEIYETVSGQVQPENGFFSRLGNALGSGWDGLLSFFIGVLTIWPFWLILGVVVLLVRRWWRNRKV